MTIPMVKLGLSLLVVCLAAISAKALGLTNSPTTRAATNQIIVDLNDAPRCVKADALAPAERPGEDGPATAGSIDDASVSFSDLDPGQHYDLRLRLSDATILHGVNLDWYDAEPSKPRTPALNADDFQQINSLVSGVLSFYNISRIITFRGDHRRATVLVERIRSNAFHSDTGGQVIWRVEIWYFKNQHGGWQEITQQNKVLQRVRFNSQAEYAAATDHLRWVGELGGLRPGAAPIEVSKEMVDRASVPASAPAPADADEP